MRVLQVNAVYGHGSTGTIVRDIEQLCFKSGIECYVASPDPKVRDAKHGYVIGNTLDHKLHAILSRIHGKQGYFSHLPTKRLLRWMDEIKPDIVHLHNLHSNYIHLNMLLKYLAKKDIRTIITLHDCWFYTGGCFHYTADGCKGWLANCGVCPAGKSDPTGVSKETSQILADRKRYFLAIPRLVVTGVSNWISEEARRTFFHDSNVVTVRNGVDMEVFKPSPSNFRKRLGLEGKYVILGPASKWLQPVNKQVLIDFAAMMKDDEVLLLFGVWSDSQLNYLKSLNLLNDKVKTYGYTKDRTELAQLYTMADVFANVTREDSLSLINVEAQACGTPVVTFNQTGPKETVDDVSSFNVQVGDAYLLYNAVQKVRVQTTGATSEICRQFVKEFFEVNTNYNKYISLYKEFER